MKFAVGDIVRFKSGGEKMVVRGLDFSQDILQVECLWFNGHGAVMQKFAATELEVIPPNETPPEPNPASGESSQPCA